MKPPSTGRSRLSPIRPVVRWSSGSSQGPASVSELKRPLVMSLPAVMQHLAVLETSGLVVSQKAGRVRTCRINPAALAEAERWITERRLEWERRLDRLGEYLKTLNSEGKSDEQDR